METAMPLVHSLDAGTVIDMGNGRHAAADAVDTPHEVGVAVPVFLVLLGERLPMLLQDRSDQEHIRRVLSRTHGEPLVHVLTEDTRGKGSKALAKLDLEIHRGLHLRRARVPEDASASQSTRPELHAPLEPAHHFFFCEGLRRVLEEVCFLPEMPITG